MTPSFSWRFPGLVGGAAEASQCDTISCIQVAVCPCGRPSMSAAAWQQQLDPSTSDGALRASGQGHIPALPAALALPAAPGARYVSRLTCHRQSLAGAI